MRFDLSHAAKFAALALAVVITYAVSSHAEGSFERAPELGRGAEANVQAGPGDISESAVPTGSVRLRGTPWTQDEEEGRHMESKPPVAGSGGDHGPVKVTAGSGAQTILTIRDELKATITLLRAFGWWIRVSPELASGSIG